jgi:cysteine sulfinate desulfinase/cysteine desulfurase-like protein
MDLVAMDVDPELAMGAVRFSMGRATTREDVTDVAETRQTVLEAAPA